MQTKKINPIMKIVAKAAKITADAWPADNCYFWTYSPKKPKSIPKLDAPLKKVK